MFYNVGMTTQMVGARELGQNVSRVLREVAESGERLVTVRGRPVARLSPVQGWMASPEADIVPVGAPMSLEEFDVLSQAADGPERYELIQGALSVSPPPDLAHQACLSYLTQVLIPVVGNARYVLQGVGVRVSHGTHLIPDLCVLADRDLTGVYLSQAPLLVVEVTSGNRRTDLVDKRLAYAAVGVEAYWVVDRREQELLVFTLHQKTRTYPDAEAYVAGRQTIPTPVGPVDLDVDTVLHP